MDDLDCSALDGAGLNLHAVLGVATLPAGIRQAIGAAPRYRSLMLIGGGGRRLWERLSAASSADENPIDAYAVAQVETWLTKQLPGRDHEFVYPGKPCRVDLQELGRLAGWHHDTPFRLGINDIWGVWFAYRAVLLVADDLPVSAPLAGSSPCHRCMERDCVAACPAHALDAPGFSLAKCIAYRRQPDSRCRVTCVARTSCPVRPEHRYDDAQIAHSYSRSLVMIEKFY